MIRTILSVAAGLLLLVCCGHADRKVMPRQFPQVGVPAVCTTPESRLQFLLDHYWDAFFSEEGPCDSALVLGVPKAQVEQALANYIGLMDLASLEEAQQGMGRFFGQLSSRQMRDTSSRALYLQMTEMVARYLYDPNSPLRDEDYYLPFVRAMAESPLTEENMRTACRYEASGCALNPRGSLAPDFRIRTRTGRTLRLRDIRAGRTVLFFSNPGCSACREIMQELTAVPGVEEALADGTLAIVNVYIDGDLKAWKEYEAQYPDNWINGYEPDGAVRERRLYDVRAIPSLYLLDADQRILLKDAPVEKVLARLKTINEPAI